ncbi:MAG: ATP-binding cassette domain-containing protein [Anaerolineae bacterium]|nr:ATP-binding cassette domain-containing protein [Anaerolineae bacterium]
MAIVGAAGSGKNVLLKTITGLIRPARGKISWDGLDCWKQSREVRRLCVYLPADPVFDGALSVNELINFNVSLRPGIEPDWNFIQTQVERFKIEPREKLKNFGVGQQKIITLLSLLMFHPKLVLVNEPLKDVEQDFKDECLSLFEQITPDQTLLVATSDPVLAGKLCRRAAIFQHGRLINTSAADFLSSQIVRRVEIKFANRPPLETIMKTEGVRQISWEDTTLRCLTVGQAGALLKSIQSYSVLDYKSSDVDLDELIDVLYTGEIKHD